MMKRRDVLLAALGTAGFAASAADARPATPAWTWIYGEWRSDVERSMAHFTFQGKRPTQENLARIASMFGHMTHVISPGKFTVVSRYNDMEHRETYPSRVARHTASSTTLTFEDASALPELTLYKGDGFYLVRVGANFEYFSKVA